MRNGLTNHCGVVRFELLEEVILEQAIPKIANRGAIYPSLGPHETDLAPPSGKVSFGRQVLAKSLSLPKSLAVDRIYEECTPKLVEKPILSVAGG
jgi:hypothetical protein